MEDEKEETRTEENREEEPRRRSGYYINQPVFGEEQDFLGKTAVWQEHCHFFLQWQPAFSCTSCFCE